MEEELKIGKIYETFVKDEHIGEYLYLGRRKKFRSHLFLPNSQVNVMAGINHERGKVECFYFGSKNYSVDGEKLMLKKIRPNPVFPRQKKDLAKRLEKAGL